MVCCCATPTKWEGSRMTVEGGLRVRRIITDFVVSLQMMCSLYQAVTGCMINAAFSDRKNATVGQSVACLKEGRQH